jgi:hypothetical protein
MPQLEFFLVCRSVQTDINTNEVSFINVLEDLVPDEFPYFIDRAIAVSLWNFQKGDQGDDYQASLVVRVPGMPDARFNMNLSSDQHRFRAVQGVLGIPIEQPCDITFEVLLNGNHAATHIIKVHPPETKSQPAGGESMPQVAG